MAPLGDDVRQAAADALARGWSLTLRDTASGDVTTREGATGYMHVTLRGVAGQEMMTDDTWRDVACVARETLTYGRRRRVRLAMLLQGWLDCAAELDGERFTLTGSGACEVCGRTLTRSVARGFTTGDDCGGRTLPTLSERKGWRMPLTALMLRAGMTPPEMPRARCAGTCDPSQYCPDCDA